MTRSVIWSHPVGCGEIILRAERTDGYIQWKRLSKAAEIGGDLCLPVAPGVYTNSHAWRPVVVEGIGNVSPGYLLLFPAHASVEGNVLTRRPVVLREHRVISRSGLEVQQPKLPTILAQKGRNTTVRA